MAKKSLINICLQDSEDEKSNSNDDLDKQSGKGSQKNKSSQRKKRPINESPFSNDKPRKKKDNKNTPTKIKKGKHGNYSSSSEVVPTLPNMSNSIIS